MPQLPLIGELGAPVKLTIAIDHMPTAKVPTSSIVATVIDRKRNVLAAAGGTITGVALDYIPSVIEAVVQAYLYAEPAAVERALQNGLRDARAHGKRHESR